ncbi:MAG: ComF family protein [Bacteroidales bacterium]|nr:ComF family protein [Bacteroidales bacterium]
MGNFTAPGDFPRAILDLLLPRECIVCGRVLARRERYICTGCLADLPLTHYSRMSRNPMADRLNAMIARSPAPVPERYSYATALFFYRSGYKDITRCLKYKGDIKAGCFFAGILGNEMAGSELFRDVDMVVPVPLHWSRKWSRGYNQAEVIAKEIARRLGAELRTDLLFRPRRTRTQTRLPVSQKVANVEGAFRFRKGMVLPGELHHILIVDDVFTTGATSWSCYKVLKGICSPRTRISVATLACVGE